MKRIIFYGLFFLALNSMFCVTKSQDIKLPAPGRTGGKPLMEALDSRQSVRTYTNEDITRQQLSDILWAAWGINRSAENKRTAPSARNIQEIDLYVILPTGLYLYVAGTHTLQQIHNRDIRSVCGTQDFVSTAPLNIVMVADMAKLKKKPGDEIKDADLLWSYANAGFISQNIYLYCASANLGGVIRGLIPKEKLAPEMGLRSNQVILLAHTIGVPVK